MTKKRTQAPPWTITKNSWQYTTIYDADRNTVCRFDLEDWDVTERNQDSLERAQTRAAERIVKAVNNHDALVKALQTANHYCHRGSMPREAVEQIETALNAAVGCSLAQGDRS